MLHNGEFLFIESVFFNKLLLYALISHVYVLIGVGTCMGCPSEGGTG